MKLKSTLLKSTVIAALVAAPMAPVMAQTATPEAPAEAPAQSQAPVETPAPAADFSDEQLTAFVDAATQVQAVQQDYMMQIEGVEEPEGKQKLVEEAQAEMADAVNETDGMDVNTYNEIGQAAQADPQLNERIMAMLQERTPASPETMTE
ncbi:MULTISPECIES: DUF4168 domain-containing protein [Roseobacteraceae]|uniref:DUF4168 domain-containing protein n=1 Tax=Roseobacteraceae TaxID=2854170 RepID=UPI0013BABAE1|nr:MULTISPECIES: DUF4168 domain-containing protein [Roseobacteraceae]MCA0997733.1 DUF4168 domain-containing protein [Alloyangia pacifica]NDW01200.1 DUF4168 domain-containing protein [Salipiger sp. PrR002]NDW58864.1 DUF4168 domain-containing protein [Salipiger sp. PrR004]